MPPSTLSAPPTPSRIPIPTVPASPKKYQQPLASAGGDRDVRMDTAKWNHSGDVYMQTAKGWDSDDIRMETARPQPASSARPPQMKLWERELLESPEVKRKATVAQLCKPSILPMLTTSYNDLFNICITTTRSLLDLLTCDSFSILLCQRMVSFPGLLLPNTRVSRQPKRSSCQIRRRYEVSQCQLP